QEDECIYWNTAEYEFNQGDYVVFCVYNDTASDIIDISLGNTHRQRCLKGQWTMVIWSAADFVADGGFSRLFERDSNGNWAGDTTGLAGTVYFSKAKVYSSDQVKNLTEVEDTFEYTVGNSTFIGKAAEVNGNYNPDKNAFNDPTYAMPYYVNGVLRWNANSKINTQASDFWPKMGFTFKEAKEVTVNTYLYLTLGNDVKVAGSFHVQAFNSDGFVAAAQLGGSAIKGELVEGSTYRFHIGKYAGTAAAKDFKLFRLCADWVGYPTSTHFVVTDVTVINVTAG
ncbi:MAG: hypothetical protein J6C62_00040, partial [Clostridia bacterium]|nr:hypothetical protein [Clostridia bacterium]